MHCRQPISTTKKSTILLICLAGNRRSTAGILARGKRLADEGFVACRCNSSSATRLSICQSFSMEGSVVGDRSRVLTLAPGYDARCTLGEVQEENIFKRDFHTHHPFCMSLMRADFCCHATTQCRKTGRLRERSVRTRNGYDMEQKDTRGYILPAFKFGQSVGSNATLGTCDIAENDHRANRPSTIPCTQMCGIKPIHAVFGGCLMAFHPSIRNAELTALLEERTGPGIQQLTGETEAEMSQGLLIMLSAQKEEGIVAQDCEVYMRSFLILPHHWSSISRARSSKAIYGSRVVTVPLFRSRRLILSPAGRQFLEALVTAATPSLLIAQDWALWALMGILAVLGTNFYAQVQVMELPTQLDFLLPMFSCWFERNYATLSRSVKN
ncbi:hypothetical protein IW262DRAFT_1505875 [Armillaria fumosa]|nr:hypothetical protein IW262DRAFT_1505875 [Armillaria fumosa]